MAAALGDSAGFTAGSSEELQPLPHAAAAASARPIIRSFIMSRLLPTILKSRSTPLDVGATRRFTSISKCGAKEGHTGEEGELYPKRHSGGSGRIRSALAELVEDVAGEGIPGIQLEGMEAGLARLFGTAEPVKRRAQVGERKLRIGTKRRDFSPAGRGFLELLLSLSRLRLEAGGAERRRKIREELPDASFGLPVLLRRLGRERPFEQRVGIMFGKPRHRGQRPDRLVEPPRVPEEAGIQPRLVGDPLEVLPRRLILAEPADLLRQQFQNLPGRVALALVGDHVGDPALRLPAPLDRADPRAGVGL